MKKIALILAILCLLMTLVACKKNQVIDKSSSSTSSTTSSSSSTSTSKKEDPVVDPKPVEEVFTEASGTVYVSESKVNIRKTAKVEANNIYGTAYYGNSYKRLGVSQNWTKIEIEGTAYYISNSCITLEEIVALTFDPMNKTMYINIEESLNVRSESSIKSSVLTSVKRNTAVTVIGLASQQDIDSIRWAKINITVEERVLTGYVNYNKLSETEVGPYVPGEPKDETDPEEGLTFDAKTDSVKIIADTLNLRTAARYDSKTLSGISVPKDTVLVRTGVATAKDADEILWSRVVFEGKTYYISTSTKYVEVIESNPAN